jgi:hypothetical protein
VNIQQAQISKPAVRALPPQKEAEEIADESEQYYDDYESTEIDEENFTWGQLGKGLAGSVVGGVVVGAGGAVAGIMKTPKITYEAVKGVWKSEMLGPILKTTVTPVIIAAGLAAPVLTAIGATGYGLFQGFKEGAEKSPVAAGQKGIETVKEMRGKVTHKIVEGIREAATQKPESEDDVYEIRVIEGVKGLAASATSTAVGAVGIGATTALHVPGGYVKASSEIWKSDAALPLKVGGQVLATAAAGLAVPFGVIGGGIFGLGMGAYKGYTDGFVAGNKETLEGIGDFHEMAKDAIYD